MFFLLSLVVRSTLRPNRPRGSWGAGVLLGLMLVLKSAGLWLLLLFAAVRRWRTSAAAVAIAALMALVFSPLVGWRIWPHYLARSLEWVSSEPSNQFLFASMGPRSSERGSPKDDGGIIAAG